MSQFSTAAMSDKVMKVCSRHGLSKHFIDSSGRARCMKCRVEAVQRRRDRVKQLAVEYKGSRCIICGYDNYIGALEFHHLDPKQKEFGISTKGYTRGMETIKRELDKCILVCSNCHKEIHAGLIKLDEIGRII